MHSNPFHARPLLPCLLCVAGLAGCADDDAYWCADGDCGDAGDAGDAVPDDAAPDDAPPVRCGDGVCSAPAETAASCPADCAGCVALADVTPLIGAAELFFGYSVLGSRLVTPSCGVFDDAREVAVTLAPAFDGELVLSTRHPSTRLATVLEVREADCAGPSLGCSDRVADGGPGARLTIVAAAGTRYVALVETADDDAGVFALGLHRPGVCESLGTVEDITTGLLAGSRFATDTSAGTSSQRGTCNAAVEAPEALLTFTAPRDGTMAATTLHPDTALDAVLHVREGGLDGEGWCDSPEAEVGCGSGAGVVRFDVRGGLGYDLFVDGAAAGAAGAATVTLGYAATSPTRTSLRGCSHATIQDVFAFPVESGQAVLLQVDTVDAATAADTRLRVRLPDGTELHEADDEFTCTFPPPEWSCPRHEFTAATGGLYTVEIYVGSSENCADRALANYELTVTVGGAPSELILIKDQ
ncbi:MAG: hypothetical protein JXB32_07675 [Deltaproteobacteria bacterium]|nr:hypothetical protein [Deltaproteobacteria bacterium]